MPETFHAPDQVKVFILYLLEKVGYPLEYNDLAAIVIRDGYVDYFDFVTYFHELMNDGHIAPAEPDSEAQEGDALPDAGTPEGDGRERYVVTETGRMIARGLSDDLLLAAVREKSYVSAMRHLSLEKRGAVWEHSIEQDGEGYLFHCTIRDKDGLAFRLDLRADSFMQAQRMRMNFEDKPDVVYRGLVAIVTGNVNYLFDK